jgi:hypothetical protein
MRGRWLKSKRMANIATYRIQLINAPIPDDDAYAIKKKLGIPTMGYGYAGYFRHVYPDVEGGEIAFNCRWGYDRDNLQDYLRVHGNENSIAWVIQCGYGDDAICSITQKEVSKYEDVRYGFDLVEFKVTDYFWYWFHSRKNRESKLDNLNLVAGEDAKKIVAKVNAGYGYETSHEIIDFCAPGDMYREEIFSPLDNDFSEKVAIPISIDQKEVEIRQAVKEVEHSYEHIKFYWQGEVVFQLNSNRYLNFIHRKEYRGFEYNDPKYYEWESKSLENGFCHESFYSKNSFENCVNKKYLNWRKNIDIGKVK